MVDAANEVLKVNPELIEPPPDIFEQGELNYVTGVGKLDGKLVILIDVAKIMSGASCAASLTLPKPRAPSRRHT